jgi:hypothetical protein
VLIVADGCWTLEDSMTHKPQVRISNGPPRRSRTVNLDPSRTAEPLESLLR